MPRSAITGLYVVAYSVYYETVFQDGCIILYSHRQSIRDVAFRHLYTIWNCVFFFSLYLEKTQLPLQGRRDLACLVLPTPPHARVPLSTFPFLCFSSRSALPKSSTSAAASLEMLSPNFGNSDLFFSFCKLLSLELTLWLRW